MTTKIEQHEADLRLQVIELRQSLEIAKGKCIALGYKEAAAACGLSVRFLRDAAMIQILLDTCAQCAYIDTYWSDRRTCLIGLIESLAKPQQQLKGKWAWAGHSVLRSLWLDRNLLVATPLTGSAAGSLSNSSLKAKGSNAPPFHEEVTAMTLYDNSDVCHSDYCDGTPDDDDCCILCEANPEQAMPDFGPPRPAYAYSDSTERAKRTSLLVLLPILLGAVLFAACAQSNPALPPTPSLSKPGPDNVPAAVRLSIAHKLDTTCNDCNYFIEGPNSTVLVFYNWYFKTAEAVETEPISSREILSPDLQRKYRAAGFREYVYRNINGPERRLDLTAN